MIETPTDHALCHCGNGFTFDFQSKTVYCTRCATADWLTRMAGEIQDHGHYIDRQTEKASEWAAMLRKAAQYVTNE